MARYFFHLISPNEASRDNIGTELASAEAAYLEACDTALELSFEMLRARRDPDRHAFEVTDSEGRMVFEIPFAEVTRPAERMPRLKRCTPAFSGAKSGLRRRCRNRKRLSAAPTRC